MTSHAESKWQQKFNEASSSSSKNASKAYNLMLKSVITWTLGSLALAYYSTHGHQAKQFNRGMSDLWYFYGFSAFFLGAFFAFLGFSSAKNKEKKNLTLVLFAVDMIAMFTYLIHAFRLTPTLNGVYGLPVDPARFLEWICTCPVLIYLIGEVTKNPKLGNDSMNADYFLIGLGFLASIMKEPFSHLASTLAVFYFSKVVTNLYNMFQIAIEKGNTNLDPTSLKTAQLATVFAWTMFPIVWHLQKNGIISYAVGEAMFTVSDIVAKVFLTLVLVNATVEQAQNQKVEILSTIADELETEIGNTDALLERMMPASVLEQLKNGEASEAKEYENVTVFFSDIAGFTVLSGRTSTKDMMASLNKLWVQYDLLAKKWGIYKVETIGDAFLGVSGCPDIVSDHAARCVNFSIDIMQMVSTFRTVTDEPIQIRIGLNSGPVTAGVLGDMNPHWCLVGDTVNSASRMESSSKPMKIHISDTTYNLVKDLNFDISQPEVMNIKGKGNMTTYWVHGRK